MDKMFLIAEVGQARLTSFLTPNQKIVIIDLWIKCS